MINPRWKLSENYQEVSENENIWVPTPGHLQLNWCRYVQDMCLKMDSNTIPTYNQVKDKGLKKITPIPSAIIQHTNRVLSLFKKPWEFEAELILSCFYIMLPPKQ